MVQMNKVAAKSKLTGFERIKNVHLAIEPFTVENELLTPTLKLKRPQAAKAFRSHLDRLYEEALAEEKVKAKI